MEGSDLKLTKTLAEDEKALRLLAACTKELDPALADLRSVSDGAEANTLASEVAALRAELAGDTDAQKSRLEKRRTKSTKRGFDFDPPSQAETCQTSKGLVVTSS